MHQSVLPMTSCKQSPAHGVGKEVIVSIQLSTSAPAAMANFLAVILDCELEDGCTLIIGTTRLCFSEGREIPGMLALTFDGFSKVDLEAFHQRANFYHFREKKNLPPELAFDLPQLETKENDLCLRWRDWNGWQWTFKTHHEHGQHSSN